MSVGITSAGNILKFSLDKLLTGKNISHGYVIAGASILLHLWEDNYWNKILIIDHLKKNYLQLKIIYMEKRFLSFMDYFFTVLLYLSGEDASEKAPINHIL